MISISHPVILARILLSGIIPYDILQVHLLSPITEAAAAAAPKLLPMLCSESARSRHILHPQRLGYAAGDVISGYHPFEKSQSI